MTRPSHVLYNYGLFCTCFSQPDCSILSFNPRVNHRRRAVSHLRRPVQLSPSYTLSRIKFARNAPFIQWDGNDAVTTPFASLSVLFN